MKPSSKVNGGLSDGSLAQPKTGAGERDRVNAKPSEERERESFFAQVKGEIEGLYSFVRDQVVYRESTGDLRPGDVTPEDLADSVLLRAYREFAARNAGEGAKPPHGAPMGSWLKELATKQLESIVQRLRAARGRAIHLNEDIPETPPAEEVSTLGEEVLDFYQPDEDLKVEDIFPDLEMATPEELVAAKEELLRCVNTALAGMPKQWRRVLRLRHGGGLTSAELGEVLDTAEPEIERILEYARAHLRQKLVEAGCRFISKQA
jgi:RNA polymerase sigma factor (sigma-70 family)